MAKWILYERTGGPEGDYPPFHRLLSDEQRGLLGDLYAYFSHMPMHDFVEVAEETKEPSDAKG